MARKKTEALTPPAVFKRLLSAAGDELVLVGGQALAFWVNRYDLALPPDVMAISADTDFLTSSANDRAAVQRMAAVLRGKTQFPNSRALTALVGQAYLDVNDDEFINVDVIFKVIGLPPKAVRARAVRVTVDEMEFAVMHPLDVLRSRLANLYKLADKQTPKGVMQLALAVDVGREFLRSAARETTPSPDTTRSPLQPFVTEIEKMAREDAGRKVARRFHIHVADAIDPCLIPAGPFWTRKWPELVKLMSESYAGQITPR
ncbi:MAG: hypothetical protein M9951_09990 [Burkholderiaceae bacterium]|jgi:hypothetical protein|nr:hypothetical protein [Burkholderiaceae bacterium]MEB2318830.1 hypothetical protein [Pseudomonadota bacterium]